MHSPAMRRAVVSSNFVPSVGEMFVNNPMRSRAGSIRRMNKATRRSVPTRWSRNSFDKFYDRLLTRRSKILFTTSFAALRNA